MHFHLRYFFLISLLFLVKSLYAQEEVQHHIIEDGHIETMTHLMAFELSLNDDIETLEQEVGNTEYFLYPNVSSKLGFMLRYRFISAGFSVTPNFFPGNGDDDEKGETKSFNFGTALTFRHWFGEVEYSKYKGYYLENTSDFIPDWVEGDEYIQFPDFKYSGLKFRFGYSLNPRFSFPSLTSQTERQLKSAGSFIPSMVFRYYTIERPSEDNSSGQKSNNYETTIGPGYVFTYVFDKAFYLSLGAKSGFGHQHTKLTTQTDQSDIQSTQNNFIFRWEGVGGFGFNGDRWYTGIYSFISGIQYDQEATSVRNSQLRFNLHAFLGFRFEAPSFIKNSMDYLSDKSPVKLE